MKNAIRIQLAKAVCKEAIQDYLSLNNLDPLLCPADDEFKLVGSTYIADAPDRDIDILVYLPLDLTALSFLDWAFGGSHNEGNPEIWESWKKEVDGVTVNLLIVNSLDYFRSWLTAAEVCRFLFLKKLTIPTSFVHSIHSIIMDDSTALTEHGLLAPLCATAI